MRAGVLVYIFFVPCVYSDSVFRLVKHTRPHDDKTSIYYTHNNKQQRHDENKYSFVYVPLCFAYILPVGRYGLLENAIPPETSKMSKRPFVIMGFLDCLAGTLLTFAAVYLPGSLLILLPQAAIPISMILSRRIKGEKYAVHQYLGAFVVVLGIFAVLEPLLSSSRRHDPDYACVAYDDVDGYCALCGMETTEMGCHSHRTDDDGGGGGGGGGEVHYYHDEGGGSGSGSGGIGHSGGGGESEWDDGGIVSWASPRRLWDAAAGASAAAMDDAGGFQRSLAGGGRGKLHVAAAAAVARRRR